MASPSIAHAGWAHGAIPDFCGSGSQASATSTCNGHASFLRRGPDQALDHADEKSHRKLAASRRDGVGWRASEESNHTAV